MFAGRSKEVRLCFGRQARRLATAALVLPLFVVAGEAGAGTAPAVGSSFALVPAAITEEDTIFVAWPNGASEIHSGLLRLDDGVFSSFPSFSASGSVTNLAVGAGGPPESRRFFVAWVDSGLELVLAVLDIGGNVVLSPEPVAMAVQVTPLAITGTNDGALLGYAWDTDPFWDPRILEIDTNGSVLADRIIEEVGTPEQTIGLDLAARPDGAHALAYVVTDSRSGRIQRFDADGAPIDLIPFSFLSEVQPDYRPHASLFLSDSDAAFLQLSVPHSSPALGADARLVFATLGPGEIDAGPALSELAPYFPGGDVDFAGLSGPLALAVAVWEEVERDLDCGCSVPPPVRVEFRAQVMRAGDPPEADGDSFTVYLWQEGDLEGAPLTPPRVVGSLKQPNRLTVLWSDGLLRHVTFTVGGIFADGFETGDTSAWQ